MPRCGSPEDEDEGVRQVTRREKARRDAFAHLKTRHGFELLRLRGLSGARDEFHLAAIVQNLKTMALRLVWPPPDLATASVA
jgi:Transposase DDE domain